MHCSEQSAANDSDGMEQVRTPSINSIEKKAELALRVNYNLLLSNTDMLRDKGARLQRMLRERSACSGFANGVFRVGKSSTGKLKKPPQFRCMSTSAFSH